MEKRCIYHYTAPIAENPGKGSALRPRMMLQAFKNIGYTVDAVIGYGAERKAMIRQVEENIKNGVRYDFLYAESRNIPVALAEEDHVPRHPFMDFAFLRFCKRHGIPIGFFLRDIQWKYPVYRENVALWKKMVEIPLFNCDLWQYKNVSQAFYVPSKRLQEYHLKNYTLSELPPGGHFTEESLQRRKVHQPSLGQVRIFYVGAANGVSDIAPLCRTIRQTPCAELIVCTSKEEWASFESRDGKNDCDRITVVNKASDELEPHYDWCDVASLYYDASDYRKVGIPIKLFEYINHGVPIISSADNPAADYIQEHNVGWIVEDDTQLQVLLERLAEHPEEIKEKTGHVLAAIRDNTWEQRAEQVRRDLCGA